MNAVSIRIAEILSKNSKKSFGATLLTGEWGSGKTFLWMNEIVPKLESHKISPLYISLFGVASVEELKQRIMTEWLAVESSKMVKNKNTLEGIKKLGKVIDPLLKFIPSQLLDKVGINMLTTKIDWFQFFPDQKVICLDDVERISFDIDLALGFINHLIERKGTKVLLIANEEILKKTNPVLVNTYSTYKEKVIWTSIKYQPEMQSSFDLFVSAVSKEEVKKNILLFKDLILETFELGKWKNLRTLQRVLLHLEEFLNRDGLVLTKSDVAFLVALLIEEAKGGISSSEEYDTRKFSLFITSFHNKRQIEEDNPKASVFYETYFSPRNLSGIFSHCIFNFIKDGIIDETLLKSEYFDSEVPKTLDQKILKEAINEEWIFKTDDEVTAFIKKMNDFITSNHEASAYCILKVYFYMVILSKQLDIQTDQFVLVRVKERLISLAAALDTTLDDSGSNFNSKEEESILGELINQFMTDKGIALAQHAEHEVSQELYSKNDYFSLHNRIRTDELLFKACLKEISSSGALNYKFNDNKPMFFSFCKAVIKCLVEKSPSTNSISPKEELVKVREFLIAKKKESASDKTAQKRLNLLSDLLPVEIQLA